MKYNAQSYNGDKKEKRWKMRLNLSTLSYIASCVASEYWSPKIA